MNKMIWRCATEIAISIEETRTAVPITVKMTGRILITMNH